MSAQFQGSVLSGVTATSNSAAIDASNLYSASVQIVGTGSLAGTVKIQASNDSPIGLAGHNGGTPFVPTNWTDIPGATAALSAGSSALVPTTLICYQFIRVVFTASGGTGTASATIKTIAV
jgi:hypothetical protein